MRIARILAIFAMAGLTSLPLHAQATSGNIFGTVSDEQGSRLAGAAAILFGCGAPRTTTTDARGNFRFLNLPPCAYTVRTELPGFTAIERTDAVVDIGTTTELTMAMKIAPVATTVTVSAEPPLIDRRKQTSGATFTKPQLESIPTTRDPWALLQQTPGVLLDRQNVGGTGSGEQPNFVGKGTDPTQNAWNVDGVSLTSMAPIGLQSGSSSTWYDFDAFAEMQMTTGGSDPSVTVPGVTINLVTKRGTNEVHGSARLFDTPGELSARPGTVFTGAPADTVQQNVDYGVESGGPLWPDRAWLWGSYGRQQIDRAIAGATEKATLENYAGKLNIQPVESNSFTLLFFRGDKLIFGWGASPTHPQPTTWDLATGPPLWKGEDSQVFGPDLVASADWSWENNGYTLTPEGGAGPNGPDVYQDGNGVWHNSYAFYSAYRPQHQADASLSSFFNTGSIGHELKFGFGYRTYGVRSMTAWPGQGNVALFAGPGSNVGQDLAKLTRYRIINTDSRYLDAYVGDTLTAGNLTVNVGLRYDHQQSKNLPSRTPANIAFPDLLGAVDYPGSSGWEIDFRDWQPRLGLTCAVGARKTTLLRASYARFADQLGAAAVTFENPIGYQYLYYSWSDGNGNKRPDPGELSGLYYAYGVNPEDPNNPVSPNRISPHLENTTTDEFMVGVDHELLPGFVAGLTYTYRHRKNFSWTPYTQLTAANYDVFSPGVTGVDQNGHPIGTTGPIYTCTFEGVACGAAPGFTFGRTLENRPGYSTDYQSIELALTRRLANRWMLNGNFTWTDWKQKIGRGSCQDPTNVIGTNGDSCDNDIVYSGNVGGLYHSSDIFINAKWAFNVAALYQLPWNFNLAANLYGRQGYSTPYFVVVDPQNNLGSDKAIVGSPDGHRNPSSFLLDLKTEKVIPLRRNADLTLSVDVFNALNSKTVIKKNINATPFPETGKSSAGQIVEVQSPRILRFGARVSF